MTVRITDGEREQTLQAPAGSNLLALLREHGYSLAAACGGRGVCGKCKVRVRAGRLDGAEPDAEGWVAACRVRTRGDVAIELPSMAGGGLERSFSVRPLAGGGRGMAVACDVGTTTLAAAAVDLATGRVAARTSRLNPQAAFGADVVSRILACSQGRLGDLHDCLVAALRTMIAELSAQCGGTFEIAAFAGNTTMQHLLAGVDPTPIGRFPCTPAFTGMRALDGAALGLGGARAVLLPSVSGYFGADALAGLYAVGMNEGERVRLFVDIGTNGEIALRVGGRLYCASTAAGPALEGACIECGAGGVAGAVDRVFCENDRLLFRTVGGEPPVGICGCGLVDLIAELLRAGVIDPSGLLGGRSPYPNAGIEGDRFVFAERLWLSQRDVRQFQLAKSAVRAGIAALCAAAGVAPADVEEVLIAGGLGYYLDVDNTLATGILPAAFAGKIRTVGNTSLHGAALAAAAETARAEIARLAAVCEIVELNDSPVFTELFISGMTFEAEDGA